METIEINYSTDPDTLDHDFYMTERILLRDFRGLKVNDSSVTRLSGDGDNYVIESLTNEEWEQVGRNISSSIHLESMNFSHGALNDEKISFLSRGLTESYSIIGLNLDSNALSATGLRCMVPFLENTSCLRTLSLNRNKLKSEGFNLLLRALTDSPIRRLFCDFCGVDSGIDIESIGFPKKLNHLSLHGNNLKNDGCREIAKLLRRRDTALEVLNLDRNGIGDEGVAAIVDALQNNTKVMEIGLTENDISKKGRNMFLKLVNDISSIEATLHSNHTLTTFNSGGYDLWTEIATRSINWNNRGDPEAAGREKIIQTQLNSVTRAGFTELQGVNHSVYSEINPLHLPEVLSLVSQHHGHGELYTALKLSIGAVIGMVDMKECVKQHLAYYSARSEDLRAKLAHCIERSEAMNTRLAAIEAAEGSMGGTKSGNDVSRPSKRSRK